jgi:hypothetical protein
MIGVFEWSLLSIGFGYGVVERVLNETAQAKACATLSSIRVFVTSIFTTAGRRWGSVPVDVRTFLVQNEGLENV